MLLSLELFRISHTNPVQSSSGAQLELNCDGDIELVETLGEMLHQI